MILNLKHGPHNGCSEEFYLFVVGTGLTGNRCEVGCKNVLMNRSPTWLFLFLSIKQHHLLF